MKSDTKFRGQRVDNGELVYGDLIHCISGKVYIFPSGNYANESDKVNEEGCLAFLTFEVIPETVGEYIGIKDNSKKEVKIYTDDIVQASYNMFDYVILKVIFDEETLMYSFEDFEGNKECCDCFDEIIVKGNIYENLELLEVENE